MRSEVKEGFAGLNEGIEGMRNLMFRSSILAENGKSRLLDFVDDVLDDDEEEDVDTDPRAASRRMNEGNYATPVKAVMALDPPDRKVMESRARVTEALLTSSESAARGVRPVMQATRSGLVERCAERVLGGEELEGGDREGVRVMRSEMTGRRELLWERETQQSRETDGKVAPARPGMATEGEGGPGPLSNNKM